MTYLRLLVCAVYLTFSFNVFSQVVEGYGGLPWGTSVSEAKMKFQNLIEKTGSDDQIANQRLFNQQDSNNAKILRFFNDQLYWGRTAYENIDLSTLNALTEKITETFGLFDDSGKGTESGNEYFWSSKHYSNELDIELRIILIYDSYGRNTSNLVFITYENPILRKKLDDFKKNQKKKELEL